MGREKEKREIEGKEERDGQWKITKGMKGIERIYAVKMRRR